MRRAKTQTGFQIDRIQKDIFSYYVISEEIEGGFIHNAIDISSVGFRLDQALAKIIDQLDNIIDELEKEEEE